MFGNDQFTKLLLHCEGTNGSTTFTDNAAGTTPHTVTVNGNAQISTAQSKFGASAYLGDGTGDYLSLDGSTDFAFGSGDFSVDLWVRLLAVGAVQTLYDSRPAATSGFYPTLYINTDNTIHYFTNTADRITGTTALTTGTWYHVALARLGTSTKLFLNGTQEGSTFSDSNTYLGGGAGTPIIGAIAGGANSLNGYIDEIRVGKGIAYFTANFTPQNEPYDAPANPNINNYSVEYLIAQMARTVMVPY